MKTSNDSRAIFLRHCLKGGFAFSVVKIVEAYGHHKVGDHLVWASNDKRIIR